MHSTNTLTLVSSVFATVANTNPTRDVVTTTCRIDDISALRAELRLRQRRLGTANEQPDDFEATRALAHQINNRLTIEHLASELRFSAPREAVGW